jgi:hypothetical protein
VFLYVYYPDVRDVFFGQDETCPYLCKEHLRLNKENPQGYVNLVAEEFTCT